MFDHILNKLQKWFRTDIRHLSSGAFWLGLGQVIAAMSTFILSIAFANLPPQDVFGSYRYILSLIGIVSAFSLTGANLMVSRAVAKGLESSIKQGLHLSLLWNSAVFIGGLCIGGYYLWQGNEILGWSLLIASALQPYRLTSTLYMAYLSGLMQYKLKFILRSIHVVLATVALLVALFLTNNLIILVTTYFFSYTIIGLCMFMLVKRLHKPNERTDPHAKKNSVHLSIMTIGTQLVSQLDKVLIFQFLGPTQLAVYAFAILPYSELKAPSKIIASLAVPKMSTQKLTSIHNTLHRKVVIFFFANLVIFGTYIILAPHIFALLFPKYTSSVVYSQFLALGLLASPSILYTKALVSHMKKRELYIIKFLTPTIRLLLYIILLPPFGLWGMVVAFTIGEFIYSLLALVMFIKTRGVKAVTKLE